MLRCDNEVLHLNISFKSPLFEGFFYLVGKSCNYFVTFLCILKIMLAKW